ncbi:MAG TPA: undecaprenyl-diphosphatase UppP [Patescibacteria group bacterium]|nr:undecaprenyl-diphosphatase UppP [Patescibacteria group bacterium]
MTFLHAIILGIVEGITEFLPISSTGHLILTSRLLGLSQTDFLKTFEVAIQVGAIFAVLVLYWKKFLSVNILKKIIVAFIPTGIIGVIFYALIKRFLLGNETVVLYSLIIVGALMIIFELVYRKKEKTNPAVTKELEKMTYKQCFIIGVAQSFAMFPGVSRSAATILGGLSLGIDRKTITEFSFILAVPTIIVATVFDLAKSSVTFSSGEMVNFLVGLVVSFVVAIFAIKFLVEYIQKHSFIAFGIYRIIIALIFIIVLLR